ncbi:uncharacterized protein (DUF1330 family) [Bradyrhizobium elkanii]
MSCYWLARAKINDPVSYKRYTDQVPDILKKYGGKVLSRGASFQTLEGPSFFERYVIIEFESMDAARRCFESPEYNAAAIHRRCGAGHNELVIAESGDGTR